MNISLQIARLYPSSHKDLLRVKVVPSFSMCLYCAAPEFQLILDFAL